MIDLVSSEVRRLSGLNPRWLVFPSALEDRFEASTSPRRCKRLWLEGLLAICLYNVFLLADYLGTPDRFWLSVIVRFGVMTPLALAIDFNLLRKPGKVYRESSIAVMLTLVAMAQLYLDSNQNIVASAYAQTALLAVIVFANTSMRLHFPYALVGSTVMVLGDVVFLYRDTFLNHGQKMFGFGLTLATTSVTMLANYSGNREERLNFLLYLRGDVLIQELKIANQELSKMAESDGLTGLANRHLFDIRFRELWEVAIAEGSAFSIIMVDVDNFKQMNDTFGHLSGDRVLKRIARLITEALRMTGDFAARFGGEEFVLLLPETQLSAAMQVAERIRKLVEVAGFPPLDSSRIPMLLSMTATVSCGVATVHPAAGEDSKLLLDAADRALYQAKEDGRNRVYFAS